MLLEAGSVTVVVMRFGASMAMDCSVTITIDFAERVG